MGLTIRQRLQRFRSAPAGTRFQARYERLRRRPHALRTLLAIGLGLLLIAAGLVLLVLPGPGILVATAGAALLAGESLTLARLLDRADVWLERRWPWRRTRQGARTRRAAITSSPPARPSAPARAPRRREP